LEQSVAAAGGAVGLAVCGGAVEQDRVDVAFEAVKLLDQRGSVDVGPRVLCSQAEFGISLGSDGLWIWAVPAKGSEPMDTSGLPR
jgi:hypothetical protein